MAANYRSHALKIDDLKAQLKALEDNQFDIEQTLVLLMGDFMAAEHSGLRVSRFQSQGNVDYKAVMKALLPDITEAMLDTYRKQPANRVRITCRDDSGRLAEVPFDAEALKEMVGADFWF